MNLSPEKLNRLLQKREEDALWRKHKIEKRNSKIEQYPFLFPTHWNFKCLIPGCTHHFSLTNDLYEHLKHNHGWKDLKRYKCPHCTRTFGCMASVVYHVRTHTKEKPYQCCMPGCKFHTAAKGNLKNHLLSNIHKNVMNLDLLNTILSLDTLAQRPDAILRAPREKKRRLSSPNSKDTNFRNSSRLSYMSINSGYGDYPTPILPGMIPLMSGQFNIMNNNNDVFVLSSNNSTETSENVRMSEETNDYLYNQVPNMMNDNDEDDDLKIHVNNSFIDQTNNDSTATKDITNNGTIDEFDYAELIPPTPTPLTLAAATNEFGFDDQDNFVAPPPIMFDML